MARVKSRLGAGKRGGGPPPTTKTEILKAIEDAEVTRDVEIEFELFNEVDGFPEAGTLPGRLEYVHEKIFYIVIPPVGEAKNPIAENGLIDEYMTLRSLDDSFVEGAEVVEASFFDPEMGHLLGFSNFAMELQERAFVRVPMKIKLFASVTEGRKTILKETELQTINVSGNGFLARVKKGSGMYRDMVVALRVAKSDFPGYEDVVDGALYQASVARNFDNPDDQGFDYFGIKLVFEDVFEETQITNDISQFCMQQKLLEHQKHVEAELSKKYGGKFKKKIRRF